MPQRGVFGPKPGGKAMLEPRFTVKKRDRLWISPPFASNGHWLIAMENAPKVVRKREHKDIYKALETIKILRPGRHEFGELANPEPRELDSLIPKRDGYRPLSPKPVGVLWAPGNRVSGYTYVVQNEEVPQSEIKPEVEKDILEPDSQAADCAPKRKRAFEISVNPHYAKLFELGTAFAKDALSPIIVLKGETLNDELLAVVMPMRGPK